MSDERYLTYKFGVSREKSKKIMKVVRIINNIATIVYFIAFCLMINYFVIPMVKDNVKEHDQKFPTSINKTINT